MISLRVSLSALVLSSVAVLAQTDSKQTPAAPVTPQFPACDVSLDDRTLRSSGTTKLWQTSNDKVFFTAPGLSACGVNYTDQTYKLPTKQQAGGESGEESSAIHWRDLTACNNCVCAKGGSRHPRL